MLNKKKINFWRPAFIFTAFVIIVLFMLWNAPAEPKATMMDTSMGNMMKGQHVSGITIYDLFSRMEYQEQMREMHSHHQGQSTIIFQMSYLTTVTIFLLLPFVIGGAVILGIVWIK